MIGLAMMLAATPTMSADTRADLTCAVATAWESMSRQPEGSTARLIDTATNMFYMGRLGGRDGETNWFLVVLNEGKQNRQTDDNIPLISSPAASDLLNSSTAMWPLGWTRSSELAGYTAMPNDRVCEGDKRHLLDCSDCSTNTII